MRKLTTVALTIGVLLVGVLMGLQLSSPANAASQAFLQAVEWPVIDINEQVPITVTLRMSDDKDAETVNVPLIMSYSFRASFQDTLQYETIQLPKKASFAQIVDMESADSIKYDMTGIPYTLRKQPNVEVTWGVSPNYEDDFSIEGSITNIDELRFLNNASVLVSTFDADGEFLGASSNGSRIVSDGFDDPLSPGSGDSFYVGISDVPFVDVAYYIVQVETTHIDPPKTRR